MGLATADLQTLWAQADRLADVEFAAFVIQAFPELVDPYVEMAGMLAANWFEESLPESPYVAATAPLPEAQVFTKSAEWALGAYGDAGRDRLEGTIQRSVFNGARETIVLNVENTGSRWVRHARADACAFCRMLATRHDDPDTWYRTSESALDVVGRSLNLTVADQRAIASGQITKEAALARREKYAIGRRKGQTKVRQQRGKRAVGSTGYHDHCHCQALEVREGQEYDPPGYVLEWSETYKRAWKAVPEGTSYANDGALKALLSEWRQIDGSH